MIFDAHCHAWTRWPYSPPVPDPGRGSHANLLWEMDNAGVSRAAVVCAAIGDNPDNAGDVDMAVRTAGGRLVAFVDVDCRWHDTHLKPGARARLLAAVERHRPAGITHYMDEAGPADWLVSDEGLGFLRTIAERRLVFGLACGPSQVGAVREAARRVPNLPILIHHLWRVRAGDSHALRSTIAAAAEPNLHVKFSGFGYGVDEGWNFPLTPMRAVAAAFLEAYGPSRILWGSDWPVSLRYMTYRQTIEIVRTHGPPMDAGTRDMILGANMARLLEVRRG